LVNVQRERERRADMAIAKSDGAGGSARIASEGRGALDSGSQKERGGKGGGEKNNLIRRL